MRYARFLIGLMRQNDSSIGVFHFNPNAGVEKEAREFPCMQIHKLHNR
jgi:hypothetical protein